MPKWTFRLPGEPPTIEQMVDATRRAFAAEGRSLGALNTITVSIADAEEFGVSMSDDSIPPALTAEEWSDALREVPGTNGKGYRNCRGGVFRAYRIGTSGLLEIELGRGDVEVAGNDLFTLMALANAALPDDDPRKITREDVEALALALKCELATHFVGLLDSEVTLSQLAAKLRALLPPEDAH